MWTKKTQLPNPLDRKRKKSTSQTRGNYSYSSRSPQKSVCTPRKNREIQKQVKNFSRARLQSNVHHTELAKKSTTPDKSFNTSIYSMKMMRQDSTLNSTCKSSTSSNSFLKDEKKRNIHQRLLQTTRSNYLMSIMTNLSKRHYFARWNIQT